MSSSVSHQTVRLSRGKHSSPDQGACVMELASMLAGERFTDHPLSVSRSIGAFLRNYNDLLEDQDRQDLYEYAAKVVGTSGTDELEALRRHRLLAWAEDMRRQQPWSLFRRLSLRAPKQATSEAIARYAIGVTRQLRERPHVAVLGLIDELIALGARTEGQLTADLAPAEDVAQLESILFVS